VVYGVLVLLDALGSQVTGHELKRKITDFNKIDQRVKNDIKVVKRKLAYYRYPDLVTYGILYDNMQIFIPIGSNMTEFVDNSGKNDFYWTSIILGELLKDIFRYSLALGLPLRGCISSGYGELTNTNRVLGPIANEASNCCEITNWIGIIVTSYPSIVLNNKKKLNPNRELYEPFVKYSVPTKRSKIDSKTSRYKIIKKKEDWWVLDWPIHYEYEIISGEGKLIHSIRNYGRTSFGETIPNTKIEQILCDGKNNGNEEIATKFFNTYKFFKGRLT
jgi:hypothetical protein